MKIVLLIILATSFWTPASLRDQYLTALKSYEGTPYATPGEPGGISCSTLARLAYLDTDAPEASREVIRKGDCLSAELRDGCHGQLTQIATSENLAAMDLSMLQPGDLVILSAIQGTVGVHTIAYLGNGEFIHADPQVGRVERFNVRDGNVWFIYPAVAVRWNSLIQ